MNTTISKDIITDLLPLYFAGQASPGTVRLVENYFAQDPGFEEHARTLVFEGDSESRVPGSGSGSEPEKRALENARRFVRYRGLLFGAAIAGTLTPLMFSFNVNGVGWWMVRDSPVQAAVLFLAGIVCWVLYAMLGAGARRTGF